MDAGSGVVTKNFNGGGNWAKTYSTGWDSHNGGPFNIIMGAKSVFKVTNIATMNATNANYGISGPATGDWAVFQADTIVAGAANQGYEVTYGGNLAVVAGKGGHFAQGYSGTYPYIDIKDNAVIYEKGDMPNITIEATECNPGFKGTPGEGEGGTVLGDPAVYTFAFEDQRLTGDYDMNDVVVKVSPSVNDDGTINYDKLDFKLVAAGATFNIWVKIGEETLFGGEVHDAFKVNRGVMVNTAGTVQSAKATKDPISHLSFATPEAVKVIENGKIVGIDLTKLNIWIDVNPGSANTADQIKYLDETIDPSAVLIPTDWAWPIERTKVTEAYTNFAAWAATLNRTDAMNAWYNTPASGKTMKNATTK